MKIKKIWWGMLVIILVFGIMIIGCDNASNNGSEIDRSLDGSWMIYVYSYGYSSLGGGSSSTTEYELKLNNGNFEESMDGMPLYRGTYTTSSGIITFTDILVHGAIYLGLENRWYSRNELGYGYLVYGEGISRMLSREVVGYLVTPNNLTFIDGNYSLYYMRKIE